MIPDDDETDPYIDFSWFYFIGKAKLGLTFAETGRLTIRTFNRLYRHYKNDFDLELSLKLSKTTYAQAYEKANKEEEWL